MLGHLSSKRCENILLHIYTYNYTNVCKHKAGLEMIKTSDEMYEAP